MREDVKKGAAWLARVGLVALALWLLCEALTVWTGEVWPYIACTTFGAAYLFLEAMILAAGDEGGDR